MKRLLLAMTLAAVLTYAAAPGLFLAPGSTERLPLGPQTILRIASDASGSTYVLGMDSVSGVSPTASFGPPSPAASYLLKLSPSGAPLSLTYLGFAAGTMAVDSSGAIYLGGGVQSIGFILKLNPAGSQILFRTQFGGRMTAFTPDNRGGVHFTGIARAGEITPTPNAFQRSAPATGSQHPFVGKLDAAGAIVYLTYLTGSSGGETGGIGVDASGSATVHGSTASSDFPVTKGAYRANPADDAAQAASEFLAKLTPDGTGLVYATYTGQAVFGSPDSMTRFTVDPAGGAILLHATVGTRGTLIRRFHPQGTGLTWSQQLPPTLFDPQIATSEEGDLYVLGESPLVANLPLRNNTARCNPSGASFLTVFSPAGEVRLSTYLPSPNGRYRWLFLSSSGVTLYDVSPLSVTVMRLTPRVSGTPLAIACFGNAASLFQGPIAPGEIISLFGESLGPETGITVQPEAGVYPKQAAGIKVTVNGDPIPLLYVQHSQINGVAPWRLTGPAAEICASRDSVKSNCITANVAESEPGVFATPDEFAVAWNEDNTRNSATNPASYGSRVTVLATGLGPLDSIPSEGAILSSPLPSFLLPTYTVFRIGGVIGSYVRTGTADVSPVSNAIAGLAVVRVRASPGLQFLSTGGRGALSRGFRIHAKP
ncbi:MAG: hypothetical protein JNK48_10185 [Bryobacterales bacterium]|nr:hypothetical protein [Bryobacterales bacterium]